MKLTLVLLILIIGRQAFAADGVPSIKPEDMPKFVSVGAVVTFEEICLLRYPDRALFEQWQKDNESNVVASSAFKNEPSDESYQIKTPLVSFVLTASKNNSCTLFSSGTSRVSMQANIEQMLKAYLQLGKGGSIKIEDVSKGGKYTKSFAVVAPNGAHYIEVVYSDSVAEGGIETSAVTGVTRQRTLK